MNMNMNMNMNIRLVWYLPMVEKLRLSSPKHLQQLLGEQTAALHCDLIWLTTAAIEEVM